MKAVVWHDVGDIRLDDVPDPTLQDSTDAIIRLTSSAICGTDLHMVRGTLPGMKPGTVIGHEGVGIVEQLGRNVRNLRQGDRVVVCSTIACGYCSYCRAGYFSQCDNANPRGKDAGTAFFGGPEMTGPFNGLQAEYARIPYANVTLVKLPDEVSDDQAILISDIFPTGYFGADLAEIEPGDAVAVFGCGPVGQFAIASALLMGAGRVLAIDTVPTRLAKAQSQGAEIIDYNSEDPVRTLKELTGGIGPDRIIDAVGVDANMPSQGPAVQRAQQNSQTFQRELEAIAPIQHPHDGNWHPGNAPSQVLQWAVESVAKAGTIAIIGVYPESARNFPIGAAMNKNLTVNMGNCPHRRYVPQLIELVRSGAIDPVSVLTELEPMQDAIGAYQAFDRREPGWLKVELSPAG